MSQIQRLALTSTPCAARAVRRSGGQGVHGFSFGFSTLRLWDDVHNSFLSIRPFNPCALSTIVLRTESFMSRTSARLIRSAPLVCWEFQHEATNCDAYLLRTPLSALGTLQCPISFPSISGDDRLESRLRLFVAWKRLASNRQVFCWRRWRRTVLDTVSPCQRSPMHARNQ
jgi:hypothetical protein